MFVVTGATARIAHQMMWETCVRRVALAMRRKCELWAPPMMDSCAVGTDVDLLCFSRVVGAGRWV